MIKFSILELLELVGIGSLTELLVISPLIFLAVLTLLAVIIHFRGQDAELIYICFRDVIVACGWALTIIGMPLACYVMGRAFWRAATWDATS